MAIKSRINSYLPTDPIGKNNRVEQILTHVPKDAAILDIGCVNHKLNNDDENWLHGRLCNISDDVVGLDFLEDEIEMMDEMGYDVICANAEQFDLDRKFDVIVAGELLEHLSNPGEFLERANSHLEEGGKLIVSTPNPWYLFHVLAVYTEIAQWNEEHTAWFDEIVLKELLRRHDFDVETVDYVKPSPWKWPFVHKNLERLIVFIFRMFGIEAAGGNRLVVVAGEI